MSHWLAILPPLLHSLDADLRGSSPLQCLSPLCFQPMLLASSSICPLAPSLTWCLSFEARVYLSLLSSALSSSPSWVYYSGPHSIRAHRHDMHSWITICMFRIQGSSCLLDPLGCVPLNSCKSYILTPFSGSKYSLALPTWQMTRKKRRWARHAP